MDTLQKRTKRRQIMTFKTLALKTDTARKIHLTSRTVVTPFPHKIVRWPLTVGNWNWEGLILTSCYDFNLIFAIFIIKIIHNGLPQRTAPSAWPLSESEVTKLCPTLCDPVDYSPPGPSIHGILQARILEWGAISFSRGSSWPRGRTQSLALQADALTSEPPGKPDP